MRLALAAACAFFAQTGGAPATRQSLLEARLAAIARASGSTVGVFVEHLERREAARLNAARPFPLASTFKLPLAVVALRAVERHELPPLDGKVRLEATDMLPWASPLYERMPTGGEASLREVLASLLEASDNSAADALLRLCGGPAHVRAELAALGLPGISIDRNEAEIALDSAGVAHPPAAEWTAAGIGARTRSVPRPQHLAALRRFRADPRDHATPEAMARVLARIWRGELLTAPHRAVLREGLARCHTGARRLRAGLPPQTAVADRTGTCNGLGDDDTICANDVGVLTLPSGEHVIVAAFVEDAGGPVAAKERVLAAIARAVWDAYEKPR